MLNNRKKVDNAVRIKDYARDSHFVVFCFVLVPVDFTHIPQDHFIERRKFYDWRSSSESTLTKMAKQCTVIHQERMVSLPPNINQYKIVCMSCRKCRPQTMQKGRMHFALQCRYAIN